MTDSACADGDVLLMTIADAAKIASNVSISRIAHIQRQVRTLGKAREAPGRYEQPNDGFK